MPIFLYCNKKLRVPKSIPILRRELSVTGPSLSFPYSLSKNHFWTVNSHYSNLSDLDRNHCLPYQSRPRYHHWSKRFGHLRFQFLSS